MSDEINDYLDSAEGYYASWSDFDRSGQLESDRLAPGPDVFSFLGFAGTILMLGVGIFVICTLGM